VPAHGISVDQCIYLPPRRSYLPRQKLNHQKTIIEAQQELSHLRQSVKLDEEEPLGSDEAQEDELEVME
jgi:hypothetical protein